MWTTLLTFWDQYHGLVIGFAALAAVLLANQLIYLSSRLDILSHARGVSRGSSRL
jgi:hypothetical protein